MESRTLRHSAVPPSDFLYYDPYYLLLKERSKSYPKVVEKFYDTKPVEVKKNPEKSKPEGAEVPPGFSSREVVADIVEDISDLMESDFLNDNLDSTTRADIRTDPAVIQALISTSITESLAFDPILANRIRKLSVYIEAQEKLVADLKSRIKSYEQQAQVAGDETKNKLDNNTRAMNAMYAEIDRYKAKLESAEERLKAVHPNLQADFEQLQNRYFAAMKIIDRMNWPSPDDAEGTIEFDEEITH